MNEYFPEHKIIEGEDYYSITLLGDASGRTWTEGQTNWVGFADKEARIELRKLSLIKPDKMANYWKEFRQPFQVVNENRDFFSWIQGGGHALITHKMAVTHVPWELEELECVQDGFLKGFTPKKQLPEGAFNRAPTPKTRMRILKRDGYRCKVCGRRPTDYVDVELHVHHIRPYGQRGLSVEGNLVALCHSCHKGLEPHYELNLFSLLDEHSGESGEDLKHRMLKEYIEGVGHYRETITRILSDLNK